jgi:hypothetical protein
MPSGISGGSVGRLGSFGVVVGMPVLWSSHVATFENVPGEDGGPGRGQCTPGGPGFDRDHGLVTTREAVATTMVVLRERQKRQPLRLAQFRDGERAAIGAMRSHVVVNLARDHLRSHAHAVHAAPVRISAITLRHAEQM